MAKKYDISDIKTLEGIEAIRLRPGMYIGDVGPAGVRHIALEIISNSVDEYLNGHCSVCTVAVDIDDTVTIIDDGRGVPFGKKEDGSNILEAIFTIPHTGAKFDSSGETGYNTSGGLNGIGAKATNALSKEFYVKSVRDGKEATMTFQAGKKIKESIVASESKTTGTTISFLPDSEIFKESIELEYEPLLKQLQELSFLTPGMKFILVYKTRAEVVIESQNGLIDYVEHLRKDKQLITSTFSAEATEGRTGVKIALAYTEGFSETCKLYTNAIPNSKGTHLTGFRTALTTAINQFARSNKLIKEKDPNFTSEDLKEGLILTLSLTIPDPVFSGQTKDELTSTEGRSIVQKLAGQEIKTWLEANEKDAKVIIAKANLARAAREKARKARESVRNVTVKNSRVLLPGKLSDCSSSNRKDCELFIVEGDSAAGPAKEGRDRATQAVFPIRGKILNTLKADLPKIMKNEIISSLVSAIGLTTDGKEIIVNKSKLRYGKIIITSDADVDGSLLSQ